jgi:hypothetical protein
MRISGTRLVRKCILISILLVWLIDWKRNEEKNELVDQNEPGEDQSIYIANSGRMTKQLNIVNSTRRPKSPSSIVELRIHFGRSNSWRILRVDQN